MCEMLLLSAVTRIPCGAEAVGLASWVVAENGRCFPESFGVESLLY